MYGAQKTFPSSNSKMSTFNACHSLEDLPARLVVHLERHWIRDTNRTAADQPFAASRQDNRDAEATISNSSSKRDLRQHGGDESTFEQAQVQLAKHDLWFLEQETQKKQLRELPTKTCGAEEGRIS